MGDYHQAAEVLKRNVASLTGELIRERFGLPYLPSVFSRTWLVWCLTELGAFAEASARGEEGVRIAEDADQPWDLLAAYRGAGIVCLGKGDVQRAIPLLERCQQLCQAWDISGWFAVIDSQLGYAYAVSGHMDKALALLQQAVGQSTARRSVYHARLLGYLAEAYLLDGRPDEGLPLVMSALEWSRHRKERGFQAYALRLLGEIAAHRDALNVAQATHHYRQALALAEVLGMRPLQAHCHQGLGRLYGQTGQREQARAELTAAVNLYRAMEMTLWLPQAEAMLAQML
jgi:tetratricopeptide (TPR) repeat protein